MKPRFLLDTSCLVAAVCSWHMHHEATAAEISRRLSRGEEPVMAAPALVEAYAVLTRLPAPHRLLPRMLSRYSKPTLSLTGISWHSTVEGTPTCYVAHPSSELKAGEPMTP